MRWERQGSVGMRQGCHEYVDAVVALMRGMMVSLTNLNWRV